MRLNTKTVHSLAISEAATLLKHRDFLGGDLDTALCVAAISLRQMADEVVRQESVIAAMSEQQQPDCRTCKHYLPPLSFAGEPACELVSSVIVCINGDGYLAADPARLYETARKGEGEV